MPPGDIHNNPHGNVRDDAPATTGRTDARLPLTCTISDTPRVTLTIDPAVWTWLRREADPLHDMLVLALNRHASDTPSGWIVGILPIGFPGVQLEQGFRGLLHDYVLLVPQRHHLPKLNGRLLICRDGSLSVV